MSEEVFQVIVQIGMVLATFILLPLYLYAGWRHEQWREGFYRKLKQEREADLMRSAAVKRVHHP